MVRAAGHHLLRNFVRQWLFVAFGSRANVRKLVEINEGIEYTRFDAK